MTKIDTQEIFEIAYTFKMARYGTPQPIQFLPQAHKFGCAVLDLIDAYDEAQKEIKALEEVVKKFLALEFNGEDASCPSCHECACGGNSLEHKNECVFLEARKYVNFPLHFSGYHKQGTVFVCGFCNEKLIGEENINPNHNCLLIKDRAVL